MNILNTNQSHYIINKVLKGSYKISFTIDGDFHIRFSIHDDMEGTITKYCTKTIYSSTGTYSFVLDVIEGFLCLECSPNRTNNWTQITNLTLEEIK